MIIEDKTINKCVNYSEIEQGECFRTTLFEFVYIKCNTFAIRLSDGIRREFYDNDQVEKIKAKVVIGED